MDWSIQFWLCCILTAAISHGILSSLTHPRLRLTHVFLHLPMFAICLLQVSCLVVIACMVREVSLLIFAFLCLLHLLSSVAMDKVCPSPAVSSPVCASISASLSLCFYVEACAWYLSSLFSFVFLFVVVCLTTCPISSFCKFVSMSSACMFL